MVTDRLVTARHNTHPADTLWRLLLRHKHAAVSPLGSSQAHCVCDNVMPEFEQDLPLPCLFPIPLPLPCGTHATDKSFAAACAFACASCIPHGAYRMFISPCACPAGSDRNCAHKVYFIVRPYTEMRTVHGNVSITARPPVSELSRPYPNSPSIPCSPAAAAVRSARPEGMHHVPVYTPRTPEPAPEPAPDEPGEPLASPSVCNVC